MLAAFLAASEEGFETTELLMAESNKHTFTFKFEVKMRQV